MEPEQTRQIPSSGLHGCGMRISGGRRTLLRVVSTARGHHAPAQHRGGNRGKLGIPRTGRTLFDFHHQIRSTVLASTYAARAELSATQVQSS